MSLAVQKPELVPLAYQRQVVAHLLATEPEVWAWAASNTVQAQHAEEMRAAVLRQTYRLEPDAHPEIHETCRKAMAALEIDAPVTLYQAADGAMNAALCFVPGEIHIVFHGPILERLSPEQQLALMGHELAHYRLWSENDGQFHVASRILDHALTYPNLAGSHLETARLYGLHTELYADRGGALAADGAEPAIATLVKVMTGLPNVDPAAYLRQAAELSTEGGGSQGETHPEIFLRAQALDGWWKGEADLESWLDKRVRGPLSITALDLLRQDEMMRMTRVFFSRLLADPSLRGDEVLTQVRRFFPDWREAEADAKFEPLAAEGLDDATREYLIALAFDCAMADPDARDEVLLAAARIARDIGGLEQFRTALKRDLKFTKAASDKLIGRLGRPAG